MVASGMELHLKLIVVSSAYKTGVKTLEIFGRSLIKNRNNKGPRTDPCGTPLVIGSGGKIQFWMRTDCVRFER